MPFFLPEAAYSLPQALPQQPQEPFLWGAGGQRVSADEIARQRAMAEQQLASGMDYSPIASPWQGLARVAQGVTGALAMKKADKEAANQSASAAILQNLMVNSGGANAGNGDAVLAALADPYLDKGAKAALTLKYKHDNPTPPQPHYWETNNGSLGMIGPDGVPQIVYNDPTPKMQYIQVKDPSTGGLSIVPVPVGSGMPGGGGQSSTVPGAAMPPATLPPDFDFGGPTPSASATFP
jgi:hypothetical protein